MRFQISHFQSYLRFLSLSLSRRRPSLRVAGQAVHRGYLGLTVGNEIFSDLDIADDVSLLASMLEILVLVLEILHEESSQLGLEIRRKPNYKFLMTTQAPHPRCLYLDMMLRLPIPLSTLVPALIQLAAVSTTPVGGSNYHVRA